MTNWLGFSLDSDMTYYSWHMHGFLHCGLCTDTKLDPMPPTMPFTKLLRKPEWHGLINVSRNEDYHGPMPGHAVQRAQAMKKCIAAAII